MKKILESRNWKLFDECRCSGRRRQEYRSDDFPDLSLFVWPNQRVFRINYRGSTTKIPNREITRLEETLDKLNT